MITFLKDNQCFVFGSNLHGLHGGGAARQALKWGAIYGIGVGRAGQTYAIPTLDWNLERLPLDVIGHYFLEFARYALLHPEIEFLLTKVGEGLAGFTAEEMNSITPPLPANVTKV